MSLVRIRSIWRKRHPHVVYHSQLFTTAPLFHARSVLAPALLLLMVLRHRLPIMEPTQALSNASTGNFSHLPGRYLPIVLSNSLPFP